MGNTALQRQLDWDSDRYWAVHEDLKESGKIIQGRGRGGSVGLA